MGGEECPGHFIQDVFVLHRITVFIQRVGISSNSLVVDIPRSRFTKEPNIYGASLREKNTIEKYYIPLLSQKQVLLHRLKLQNALEIEILKTKILASPLKIKDLCTNYFFLLKMGYSRQKMDHNRSYQGKISFK